MSSKHPVAPNAADITAVRNVVLVGPMGSGKTTLAHALVSAADASSRVTATSGRSTTLEVATVAWRDVVITVVDTPGYADFLGSLRAGLRAADAALFVVSSVDGVDAATQLLWDECEVVGLPRAVVVTKLDLERADFDETVAVAHRVFTGGGGVLPLHLPVHAEGGSIAGFIDLLSTQIHDWSSGAQRELDPEPEHLDLIDNQRTDLIEGIITESEDETLMDRFVNGDAVDAETLITDLERAVARGHFHPVLGFAAIPSPVGAELILDLIARGFPSPIEHALPVATTPDGRPQSMLAANPDGPLCAEVIRTTSDPYTGKVSYVRVFSGTLRADEQVHVSGHFAPGSGHTDHDVDERAGAITVVTPHGNAPVTSATAGSIVAVAKLAHAETGDTLSDPRSPLLLAPWVMPEPLLPVALRAHSAADEDKLGTALARILAEDPTLRLEHVEHAEVTQTVVWTMGEAHADLVVTNLRDRYGVATDAEEVMISLRETLSGPSTGTGRLVKQSGGHGQYAVCEVLVEPLPVGSGIEFVDKVVGGAIPRTFIGSVERGVRAQAAKGLATGYPMTDLRITLVDGKAHSVDSSDMAFATAGGLALKDAASKVPVALLEPITRILVNVPDEFVGAVLSDVAGRRGQVVETQSAESGTSTVIALVPDSELTRYAIDIRAISHGTGSFHRERAGHALMPPAQAKRVLGA
jgi:elongation factor G